MAKLSCVITWVVRNASNECLDLYKGKIGTKVASVHLVVLAVIDKKLQGREEIKNVPFSFQAER